jgi:hypothetical protein
MFRQYIYLVGFTIVFIVSIYLIHVERKDLHQNPKQVRNRYFFMFIFVGMLITGLVGILKTMFDILYQS